MKTINFNTGRTKGMSLSLKVTLISALFLFFIGNLSSSNPYKPMYDSLSCLEIEGKVVFADDNQNKECLVELISNDGKTETVLLKDNKKKFKLVLGRNSYYTIRISKKGYVTKLISVNTEMIDDPETLYGFKFETPLLKEEALVHLNKDVIEMPITIIQFDCDSDGFVYNKEYTESIKRDLRKSKSFDKNNSLMTTNSKALATAYTN